MEWNSHPEVRTRSNNMCKHICIDLYLFVPQAVEVYPYIFGIDINKQVAGCAWRHFSHPPHLVIKTEEAEIGDVDGKLGRATIEWRKRGSWMWEEFLIARPAGGKDGDVNCPHVVNE